MTTPLVSASEMAALQDLALTGMQTPVAIYDRSTVETADGQEDIWTYGRTVNGWLHSTPTPMITLVSGEMVTVNTYRLFLPVDTTILAGDHVTIGAKNYVVSDTTEEDTWQPLLNVSLRLAE
jgi:hypothetical protein